MSKINKKILIIFLIIIIMLLVIAGIFIVINKNKLPIEENKPKVIELTSENFNDYIIFDVNLSNFQVENGGGLYSWYKGTAQLTATARLRKDVEINNIIINGRMVPSGLCWAGNEYEFVLELDKNGEAEYSTQITTGDAGMLYPDEPILSALEIDKKENEFIYKDVFLVVSGSVTEY